MLNPTDDQLYSCIALLIGPELLWSCITDNHFPVRIPTSNRLFPCPTKRTKSRLEKMVTIVGTQLSLLNFHKVVWTQAHIHLLYFHFRIEWPFGPMHATRKWEHKGKAVRMASRIKVLQTHRILFIWHNI